MTQLPEAKKVTYYQISADALAGWLFECEVCGSGVITATENGERIELDFDYKKRLMDAQNTVWLMPLHKPVCERRFQDRLRRREEVESP